MREIWAVVRKEATAEFREPQGLISSATFGVIAVVAVAFSIANQSTTPTVDAGLLTVVLLFAGMLSVPRIYLAEDEQRTFETLKMVAPIPAIYFGKLVYAGLQMLASGLFISVVFLALRGKGIENSVLFFMSVSLESLTIAATLSVAGALAIGAPNRWILAAVAGFPLLLPQTALSIGVIRVGLGQGVVHTAWTNLGGLGLMLVASVALGHVTTAQLWRRSTQHPTS